MKPSRLRGIVIAVAGSMLLSADAFAQVPAGEVFIGYSYLRADPGEVEGPTGATAALDGANLSGAELSGAWYLTRQAGIEVSFGYNRGSVNLSGVMLPGSGLALDSADVDQYTFMVGPRFRLVSSDRHSLDARALFGGSSLTFDVPVSVSTFKGEEWGFAMAFGGSYTVVLTDALSFRVIQPDVLFATAGPNTRTNFRLSTGIVFRYE